MGILQDFFNFLPLLAYFVGSAIRNWPITILALAAIGILYLLIRSFHASQR